MDNDSRFIRFIKRVYKTIKFQVDYRGLVILNANNGNAAIKCLVEAGMPAMVARCGATEMRCVDEYLATGCFSEKIKREIQELSGVFPTSDAFLKRFCEYYMDCVGMSDVLALWSVGAEKQVVQTRCRENTRYCRLESLEPYYFADPWSKALAGKKVLVVHPFVESIQKQYARRQMLFADSNVLPEFASLTCVKAVQSNAGEKPEFDTWFEALDSMKQQIAAADFDVAIIGAGAYSLPLAAYVKELGKIAVQMSGATQILFGIKGRRWDNIPEVSRHFNENWIKPSEAETPKEFRKVEGGSYW